MDRQDYLMLRLRWCYRGLHCLYRFSIPGACGLCEAENESFGTFQNVVREVSDPDGTALRQSTQSAIEGAAHDRYNPVIIAGKPRSPTRKNRSRALAFSGMYLLRPP